MEKEKALMLLILLATAAAVVWTGPACDGVRERRQARRDRPLARVIPIVACRKCGRVACPWHL